MESNQTKPASYTKEVKCPVSLYRRVIGHNVIRAHYVDEKLVKVESIQFIPVPELKGDKK